MSNVTKPLRSLGAACALVMLGFTVYICGFKILDRDFWWHVKAGEIMVREHRFIQIEPFAYTREGRPYLATHEWLAQIVLWLVHAAGGTVGIILFRTVIVAATAGLLLSIDRKRLWPNIFLAIYALNIARPGFMDRPQLFTFLLLAVFLWLAYRILDDEASATAAGWTRAEKTLWWFVPLEILWVNLHGAAALLGIGIVGALMAERAAGWAFADSSHERRTRAPGLKRVLWVVSALGLGLVISPAGLGNLTYLNDLLRDKTVAFIGEWQPRTLKAYAADFAALWIISLSALFAVRKRFVFSAIVLGATGYLSLKAFRHEMLFAFAALGITVYQLSRSASYAKFLAWLRGRRVAFALCSILLLTGAVCYSAAKYRAFADRDHLYGYGTFDLARGAYDYLERSGVQGRMFNTYGIGGYLLYRGYPERKVYIDGRNVDYGFDFMSRTYAAQHDPAAWKALEDLYDLDYAVVDYDAIREWGHYPFADHLDANPRWKLVYLDDWASVYLKDTEANAPIIARDAVTLVTPRTLTDGTAVDAAGDGSLALLETQLRRIVDGNPDGIKGRILLSKLYRRAGKIDQAEAAIRAAARIQPYRSAIHEELGATLAAGGRWAEAGAAYARAVTLALKPTAELFAAAADAYDEAGDAGKAGTYRKRAASAPRAGPRVPSLPVGSADTQALAQQLLEELRSGQATVPQPEHARLGEQAIAEAEAGDFARAEATFLRALEIAPHDAELMNNLAVTYQHDLRYAEAETYYRKAIAEKADYADAEFNLGTLLYARHDYEAAFTHLKRAGALGRDVAAAVRAVEQAMR